MQNIYYLIYIPLFFFNIVSAADQPAISRKPISGLDLFLARLCCAVNTDQIARYSCKCTAMRCRPCGRLNIPMRCPECCLLPTHFTPEDIAKDNRAAHPKLFTTYTQDEEML